MDVQFQIRQNAVEMQEYMKDLFDWQNTIKKEERAVRARNGIESQPGTPAPRGRAIGTVAPAPADLMSPALGPNSSSTYVPSQPPSSKDSEVSKHSKPKPTVTSAKRHAAGHTHSSYNKWDKFDVDAALASSDEEADGGKSRKAPGPQLPKASSGPDSSAISSGAAAGAAHPAPLPARPSGPAALLDPPAAPSPPTIAFREHQQQQSLEAQEDLLRPVATTRLRSAPHPESAPAPASSARQPPPTAVAAAAEVPPIRSTQPTTPEAWRARGNDLFKAGQFDSAYECYCRSVELQPTCLGHANRAMALLKMGRWKEAVADCTEALRLDPTYVKAHQRRAAAYRQLGAVAEAAGDWEAALRLEPENRATAADRDAALDALMADQKLPPPSRRVAVPITWPAAPEPEPPAASQAAAMKAPVRHPPPVADKPCCAASTAAAAAAATAAAAEDGAAGTVAAVTAQGRQGMDQDAGGQLPREGVDTGPAGDIAAATGVPKALTGRGGAGGRRHEPVNVHGPATARVATDRADSPAAAAAPSGPSASVPQPPRTTPAAAVPAAAATSSTGRPVFVVPRTSVEFEAAWRGLASDPVRQAAYLVAIPPERLPATFKSSLTSPVLAAMMRCLLPAMTAAAAASAEGADLASAEAGVGTVAPAVGLAFLESLARVARFDLMAMSVPSRERTELRSAWEGLEAVLVARAEAAGEGAEEAGLRARLAALRPKYRL